MSHWIGSERWTRLWSTALRDGLLWSMLVCLASGVSCFSRSPKFDPADSAYYRKQAQASVLDRMSSQWGVRRPGRRSKRPDYSGGYYIHLGGTTTCSGWLRKKQTTHVNTWVTEGGPTGRQVKPKLLTTGFKYHTGFFAGAGVSTSARSQREVEAHDMIAGYDEDSVCQCVNAFASATVRGRLFLRTYQKICPEY